MNEEKESAGTEKQEVSPVQSRTYPYAIQLILVLFLLVIALCLLISSYRQELTSAMDMENNLNIQLETLMSQKHALEQKNDSLNVSMRRYGHQLRGQAITAKEMQELKSKGLKNPIKDIRLDLMAHNDLIPYKGVLGGSMQFSSDDIYILSDRWVRAYFDDGHMVGWVTLEYTVSDGGKITWKVIASGME